MTPCIVKRLFVERLHELGCEVSSGGRYEAYEASVDLRSRPTFDSAAPSFVNLSLEAIDLI